MSFNKIASGKMQPAALAVAVFLALWTAPSECKPKITDKVKLDLYAMSLCPFAMQAENAILPAVKSLESSVDFKLHFIASESTAASPAARFSALHGAREVEENIRQLCALQLAPANYMDYILERNKNYRDADWRIAAKMAGIGAGDLEACVQGSAGAGLLSENIRSHIDRKAFSSPTIDIDGEQYRGPRDLRSVTLSICGAMDTKGIPLPRACAEAESMPLALAVAPAADCGTLQAPQQARPLAAAVPAFEIQIVSDPDCKICRLTLLDPLQKLYPGAKIRVLGSDSPEGTELMKKHSAQTLPIYVLEKKVEQDARFKDHLDVFYSKSADEYVILPGPNTYTPSVQLKRERHPKHMDLFVESHSHFTVQAEAEFARMIRETSAKDLTMSMHYIVQETSGPLTSQRGERELQESLRQTCLFHNSSPAAFFSYLGCRNQNIHDQKKADECVAMIRAVKGCIEGAEGERLLRQDARLARDLGVVEGPAILWENRYGPFGWHEVDWPSVIAREIN